MLGTLLQIAFLLFSLAILMNFWRLVKGPDLPDRILALDTIYINSLALLLLLGLYQNTQTYFEAALLIAMFGFVGTIAAGKFLLRGDLIE
ncbi:cation:proton antiporter [Idiomarina sp. WRN-38]|jgi:multicomponent K+:H+ antiporter subunit F|uniref:K+/H+ antiporter subunit F n=1 Tax=Idiomarina piscisalsi TaxID=1096243 RepID=A0A432YTI8_9GAMM|nr:MULTISPECIES: K+/H+ antiporter subunit F [Idiomarina]KTG30133.1 cation:proton antiporter [Idiomarina sp. H105]MBF37798.1 K+/H+ antiporter subunit F [Idiomarinaceae bacterium]OAF14526.1 cation:proton antiporter [Idiomarina sp. WRN-38]MCH2454463.1 K+/H+ antiporter subunit F [Idiomarina sp.]MCJ8317029.1 K+/H+ antiporter subunit F [Idiomarina sp.]|tara:strand:- start:731 stop:1000 length:270 start_codon:yes stop_codon:yes gene_type:complete